MTPRKQLLLLKTLLFLLSLSVVLNIYAFLLLPKQAPSHVAPVSSLIRKRLTWQFPFVNEDEGVEPANKTKLPYPYYQLEKLDNELGKCFIDYCKTNNVHEDVSFIGKGSVGCSNLDHQDLLLFSSLWRYPLRRGGVVVEIGGMAGWEASNSLFFEKCLGWRAVIFELTPINFGNLRLNRPEAITIHGTVCKEVSFVYVQKVGAGCCTGAHSANETQYADNPDFIKVPCKPMTMWLKEHNVTRIDYLSLDTEGYELTILETIDWSYNSVHAISIEMLSRELLGDKLYEQNRQIRVLLDQLDLAYVPWLSLADTNRWNRDDVWVNQSW